MPGQSTTGVTSVFVSTAMASACDLSAASRKAEASPRAKPSFSSHWSIAAENSRFRTNKLMKMEIDEHDQQLAREAEKASLGAAEAQPQALAPRCPETAHEKISKIERTN